MILQSWNTHFYLSETMSILQIQRIFMDKRGKPPSGIWKGVHISLLAQSEDESRFIPPKTKAKHKIYRRGEKKILLLAGGWQTLADFTEYLKLYLQRKFSIRRIYNSSTQSFMLLQYLKLEFLWRSQKLVQVGNLGSCCSRDVLEMGLVWKVWSPKRKKFDR